MKITIIGDVSAITHAAAAHPVVAHSHGMTAIYSLPYNHFLTLLATGKGEGEERNIIKKT